MRGIQKGINVHVQVEVNKSAYEPVNKPPFCAVVNHQAPPLPFLSGIYEFTNQNLKLVTNLNKRHKGRRNNRHKKLQVNPFVYT